MRIEKEFIKAIQKASTPKTSAYDTSATVTRIEGSTAWVHIDGGADETPVERTIDCAVGDTVRIRLSGGAGYVIGNNTAPPTDDAVAIIARDTAYGADKKAQIAGQAAQDAIDKAVIAGEAAADAQASATAAGQAASAAQASADNASEYASRALGNLTTVQSVAETLTWITQHGAMTLTTDTTLDPTHVYFVVDANGDYVVGSTHYSIVTEPDVDDIGTYYELSIDESLNNYVATHLALTSEGLWLIPDNNGFKVLISVGAQGSAYAAGLHIINTAGTSVAYFSQRSVSFGLQTISTGNGSMAIGVESQALHEATFAGGYSSQATSNGAFAYGNSAEAIEYMAVAIGEDVIAKGSNSYAFGESSEADAHCFAFGQGLNTSNIRFVVGRFNALMGSSVFFAVGNGTADDARSNAFEVYSTGKFGTPGMYFSVNSNGEMCVTYEDGT